MESIASWMQSLGTVGHHVRLRYDPDRNGENPYTLVIDGERVCDTDDPVKAFEKYVKEMKCESFTTV